MTAKRYASEEALLADVFGTTPEPTPVEDSWVDDFVRRAATSDQIYAYAETIARLFEDPELTPNLVVWQQDDDPMAPADWRKAAKLAGRLLNRDVDVFKSRGRQTAMLMLNEDELQAERERVGEVMDAAIGGHDNPPPLPRNFRDADGG